MAQGELGLLQLPRLGFFKKQIETYHLPPEKETSDGQLKGKNKLKTFFHIRKTNSSIGLTLRRSNITRTTSGLGRHVEIEAIEMELALIESKAKGNSHWKLNVNSPFLGPALKAISSS
jgi:hypothetical protein